jgi:hypothetical protein
MFTPNGLFIVADDQSYHFPSSALLSVASVVECDTVDEKLSMTSWLRITQD